MGADQQFCLRWNNFHSNITSAFESLRDDEDFVDITLACEGRQIKAHKMVLSACSPYFRSLLKGNPCQHPIVFLKDVTFANLTSILDFMYHGEVNVSHNELATFLKTAEALKVRGLAEDEKKKDSEGYNESSSPPPSRGEPPDPGSPRPEEGGSAPDTHLSGDSPQPPPSKRQRRRSAASLHSAEDNTSETVLSEGQRDSSASVKNEPQDYADDEDNMLSSSAPANLDAQDLIKADLEDPDDRSYGPSDSVTISRSQAAMQQLQESFGSFLPGMGQAPSGFLSQGATDLPRPPPYPLEGVQGLPPGISALPGPSMSQGASQEAGQGGRRSLLHTACVCPYCNKMISNKYNLKTHILDKHTVQTERFMCELCGRAYSTKHSLATHTSTVHRGDRHHQHQHHQAQPQQQQQQQQHTRSSAPNLPPPPPPLPHIPSSITLEVRPSQSQQQQQSQQQPSQPTSQQPHHQQQQQQQQQGGCSMQHDTPGPSLAEVAAQLPATPLEGGPTHEQIQAMAQTLAQSLPSFQSFPGLE